MLCKIFKLKSTIKILQNVLFENILCNMWRNHIWRPVRSNKLMHAARKWKSLCTPGIYCIRYELFLLHNVHIFIPYLSDLLGINCLKGYQPRNAISYSSIVAFSPWLYIIQISYILIITILMIQPVFWDVFTSKSFEMIFEQSWGHCER